MQRLNVHNVIAMTGHENHREIYELYMYNYSCSRDEHGHMVSFERRINARVCGATTCKNDKEAP